MKCVVSLSGGRDSSTCLGLAVEKYGAENVYAIGFEYGSKHPQELERAQMIADYYGVPYQVVKINPEIFEGSTCTMLVGSEKEIQKGMTYAEILAQKEGKVDTYVPARNTLFSAYVLAKAESISQQFNDDVIIMLGQHADDSGFSIDEKGEEVLDATKAAYPDCSIEFVNAFAEVARISSVGKVKYWAPFVKMHKWELIKCGLELKKPVPYELCLSCYDPITIDDGSVEECIFTEKPCATCLDVKKAMKEALMNVSNNLLNDIKSNRLSLYEHLIKFINY